MSEKMHSVTILNAREIPIKAVTVFNDRAEINRTFTVSLKPGMNEIKLDNIPGRIDKDSIRVNGKGLAVIHEVKFEIEEINIENSELPKVKELFTKLKELKRESQKQKDIQSIYTARLEALDSAVRNVSARKI
uniref:DUF4140 domain-containing protein n=1 Tax=Panagrolaimus davidi TaxID=227884 RepID=A0A914QNZ9_9BILA